MGVRRRGFGHTLEAFKYNKTLARAARVVGSVGGGVGAVGAEGVCYF